MLKSVIQKRFAFLGQTTFLNRPPANENNPDIPEQKSDICPIMMLSPPQPPVSINQIRYEVRYLTQPAAAVAIMNDITRENPQTRDDQIRALQRAMKGTYLKTTRTLKQGYPFTSATFKEWIQKDYPQMNLTHGYIQSMLLESAAEYKIKLMVDVDGVPACLAANTDESSIQEYVNSLPVEVLCPASITAQVVNEKDPCPHIDKHDDLPTSEITSNIANC
ncbi:MAG: hypothetical protein EZS28_030083 [Streblomastix strix]|uniref:Uncharacterized protein n=1 Tax=Streblomastix strix TaxID=222440 RepID=A0A5J4UW56_9EUKA|nr:MAG: hypothetical protein EZS28_030083 [Streblomastix strix]